MPEKIPPKSSPLPPLTDEEARVILRKGTEAPGSGKYLHNKQPGTYACRSCGEPLYKSADKFESGCGWPSFDDELPGAVKRIPDSDGRRTEITCAACGGHLGHVFTGERFTEKNTRHCVNSVSLHFMPEVEASPDEVKQIVFAGGCFWGIEHFFNQLPGVIRAVSGYSGGKVPDPSYEQVCTGRTGHAEAVQVFYDPAQTSFEELARLFFELHDPTEINRQGVDIGPQYRSVLFYGDEEEKRVALKLVDELKANGYNVMTEIVPAATFYPAEEYHQRFLEKNPQRPSCHIRVKRFEVPAR